VGCKQDGRGKRRSLRDCDQIFHPREAKLLRAATADTPSLCFLILRMRHMCAHIAARW